MYFESRARQILSGVVFCFDAGLKVLRACVHTLNRPFAVIVHKDRPVDRPSVGLMPISEQPGRGIKVIDHVEKMVIEGW